MEGDREICIKKGEQISESEGYNQAEKHPYYEMKKYPKIALYYMLIFITL